MSTAVLSPVSTDIAYESDIQATVAAIKSSWTVEERMRRARIGRNRRNELFQMISGSESKRELARAC